MDRLSPYRGKRAADRTPEPVPEAGPLPRGRDDTFVIHEHHARRLHWDLRLERDGVLVSWALPKGLPQDPRRNHLAVQTEDHPLEYAGFAGAIPAGEYGGGEVTVWDRGTYQREKWSDSEIKIVLRGERATGRYVLFRTGEKEWLIHRMDPPPPGWEPMPEQLLPMLAMPGPPPPPGDDVGYEPSWPGMRALVYVDGGDVRVQAADGGDVSAAYPELRGLARVLGSLRAVLDGVVVAIDPGTGRPSAAALAPRLRAQSPAHVRQAAERVPVTFLIFDLLFLDGRDTTVLPYRQRRDLLAALGLHDPHWEVPSAMEGLDGTAALAVAREEGLPGVIAKRLDSAYVPGPSDHWTAVAVDG